MRIVFHLIMQMRESFLEEVTTELRSQEWVGVEPGKKRRWEFQVEGAVRVDVQIEENEGKPGWVGPWWVGPGERASALEKLREGGEGGADHANQDPF